MSASRAHIGWIHTSSIGLEGTSALTLAEISLIVGMAFAVLEFGGTEPASFAAVEVLLAGVAIIFLARPRWMRPPFSMQGFLVPALLMGVVLVQLCPFPVPWIRPSAVGSSFGVATGFASLTIEPFTTRRHFLILLTCVIGFFLAQIVSRDPVRKRHLIVGMVTLGLFEAFYGLVQYLTGWQRIFGYVKKYDLEEATGTYINRNHYAGFLEMVFPFALAFAFRELRKLHRKRPEPLTSLKKLAAGPGVHKLVLWLSVAIVLFVGLVCARSRMGIASASVSVMLIFGLAWASQFRSRAGMVLCGAFLVLSVGLAVWLGGGSIVERFQGIGQEYAGDYSRVSIWRDTLTLIRHRPWLGTGLGTFPIAYTAVQTTFLGEFVNHAHNDYLELASDLGIPAAFGLIASFVWLLARAIQVFRATKEHDRFVALGCAGSIVAILLHSLVDFNLYIPANCLVFATILGVTISLQPKRESFPSQSE